MYYLKDTLQQLKQISIEKIEVDYNLVNSICAISKQYGENPFLVVDENTVKLLDKNTLDSIANLVTPCGSIASLDIVKVVKDKIKNRDLVISFGSGTVNDICKYASYLEKKIYISFPTAASMNGYTSNNASILVNGHKESLKAHLPKAIYVDINTLVNAPLRLTLSGFADFICRSTVQADWMLSHLLLDTKYNELPFLLTTDLEQILLREYMKLAARDQDTIMLLMEALLISGLGMVMAEGSYSASQGEHMITHAMEMVTEDHSSLHGEKIAVTTCTMASIQAKILSIQNPVVKPTSITREYLTRYFNNDSFTQILEQKRIIHQEISKVVHKKWNSIRDIIEKPRGQLQQIFKELSMPYLPEHLGWSMTQYHEVVNLTFATRDRFTFLDLAHCLM